MHIMVFLESIHISSENKSSPIDWEVHMGG